jgi:hypothetical protein
MEGLGARSAEMTVGNEIEVKHGASIQIFYKHRHETPTGGSVLGQRGSEVKIYYLVESVGTKRWTR